MKLLKYYFFFILLASCFSSCIDNDVPYPRSLGKITAFEIEGQVGDAVIDTLKYTVTVKVSDTVDIHHVKLLRMEISDNAVCTPELSQYINLDTTVLYNLSTYPDQTYTWKIIGEQTIDRYIHADNQVGEAEFNLDEFSAVIYLSKDLRNVHINEIKLGPSNSVITPDPRTLRDFAQRQIVTVTYRDVFENWTLNAYLKDASVVTNSADAWSRHAYLRGSFSTSLGDPSFSYRKYGDTQWTTIPTSAVDIDNTDFSAHILGLTPNTQYVYKAVAGDSSGEEVTFTTESEVQMPNMNFDQWVLATVNAKETWFPNPDIDANYWWDSGNLGANALGEANPTSPEESFVISGKASRMETISVLGQMAGGNIFSGKFIKTIIGSKVGAQVDFGRPFTSRPTKIHGYYYYEPQVINKTKDPYKGLEGHPDRCHIFLRMFDLDSPYAVNTAEGIYLPDPVTDHSVIAYADLVDSTSTGGQYVEFTIPIIYKDSRKPKYCALVSVASYYADYFTGGVGTLMFADEFSFIYDTDVTWAE